MKSSSSLPPSSITVETFSAKKMAKSSEIKIPWWWFRNDKGKQSVSVTFASVAFLVTTIVYVAAAFEKIGSISFRPFDVGACMAYFLPALSLYFGRRLTDTKYSVKDSEKSDQQIGM